MVVCDRGLLAAWGGEVSVVAYRRLMDPAAGIGVGSKATCIFKQGNPKKRQRHTGGINSVVFDPRPAAFTSQDDFASFTRGFTEHNFRLLSAWTSGCRIKKGFQACPLRSMERMRLEEVCHSRGRAAGELGPG